MNITRYVMMFVIAALVMACSGPKSPQENVRLGRESAAQERYKEAFIYYKIALQQDANFIEARYEMGMLNASLGDVEASERFLVPVVQAAFKPERSVPTLAAAYFQQNKVFALETLLDNQAKLIPSDALALDLALFRVLWLYRTGDAGRAAAALAIIGPKAQGCERCRLVSAYLDSNTDPVKAIGTLHALLEKYPGNAEAHQLLGHLSLGLRDPRQAYAQFSQLKALQPRAGYAELLLALSALQMEDRVVAGQHVDRLLADNRRQPVANHLKALLSFAKADHAQAKHHAEQSITWGLMAPANFLVAGVASYHLQEYEIAYNHLRKAMVFYPDNAELQRLLLAMQLKFGYLEEAQETYLQQDVRSVKDVLFGNAMAYQLIKDGKFSAAGNVLALLDNTPLSTPAIRLQSAALRGQLNPEDAMPGSVAETDDDVSRLATIMILLQTNSLEQAQQAAQAWVNEAPDSVDALNSLAYVYQKSSIPEQAQVLYARAQAIEPNNVPSYLFAADTARAAADYTKAQELYQTVLGINERSLIALKALLQLTFNEQELPDFESLLQPIDIATVSDDQMVAIADTLFQWRQYEQLDTLLDAYKAKREWSDILWMVWLKNSFFQAGPDAFLAKFDTYHQVNNLPDHALFALSILEQQEQWKITLDLIDTLDEPLQGMQALQLTRATALIELQQSQAAAELLESLPEPEVDANAGRWYVQGRLLESNGNLLEAASYLTAYHKASPRIHFGNTSGRCVD